MVAVLSPPHLRPGFGPARPGLTSLRPRRAAVVRSAWAPTAPRRPVGAVPVAAPPTRRAPSTATFVRRRIVVFSTLVAIGLTSQLAVMRAVATTWTTTAGAVAEAQPLTQDPPAGPVAAPAVATPKVYVVRSGDTLWSIARQIQPDGDIRPLVDALADRAGAGMLQPGQRLDLDGLDV